MEICDKCNVKIMWGGCGCSVKHRKSNVKLVTEFRGYDFVVREFDKCTDDACRTNKNRQDWSLAGFHEKYGAFVFCTHLGPVVRKFG